MKKLGDNQKKVKLAVIILIILALAVVTVACVGIGLSKSPSVSADNPFGADNEQVVEKNVFVRFWENLTSIFTGNSDDNVDEDENTDEGTEGDENTDDAQDDEYKRKEGYYNFLLVGKDKGGLNTDVLMVLSFDTKNDKVAILQIPRDTYVNVPYSFKKVNAVYAAGYNIAANQGKSYDERSLAGIEALKETILTNFGIVIDRHVFVDISGFKNIVDAIGGVDVYVQHDMKYYDEYQNLEINLPKGQHHLDGKKAEGFVRFRSGYINADIGRMDAQKIFMSAFLDKLFSISTITKIPELASQVMKHVSTDISLADAVVFGKELLEVEMSEITMHLLQGEATYYNGVSYFSVYEKVNVDLVNGYFNAFEKELDTEHVDPIVLVDEPENETYEGGSSAEDINNDNPKLIYW